MSRKYWSKFLPCVKTSPRRSRVVSLAGQPLALHLCVRSGVVGDHCHCSHSWCAPWPSIASSLSKGFFLRTGPRRNYPPRNCLQTLNQPRWKALSFLQLPELGSVVPRSLALVLADGHPPWYLTGCVASSSLSDLLTPLCSKCCFSSYTLAVPLVQEGSFCLLVSNPKTWFDF